MISPLRGRTFNFSTKVEKNTQKQLTACLTCATGCSPRLELRKAEALAHRKSTNRPRSSRANFDDLCAVLRDCVLRGSWCEESGINRENQLVGTAVERIPKTYRADAVLPSLRRTQFTASRVRGNWWPGRCLFQLVWLRMCIVSSWTTCMCRFGRLKAVAASVNIYVEPRARSQQQVSLLPPVYVSSNENNMDIFRKFVRLLKSVSPVSLLPLSYLSKTAPRKTHQPKHLSLRHTRVHI